MIDEKEAERLEDVGINAACHMAGQIMMRGDVGLSREIIRCLFHGVAQMIAEAVNEKPVEEHECSYMMGTNKLCVYCGAPYEGDECR